jgi:hypothetical protein
VFRTYFWQFKSKAVANSKKHRGSDGTTVKLTAETYQGCFDDKVDCLASAEELKCGIESKISKGATVLVVKAKSWGIVSPK